MLERGPRGTRAMSMCVRQQHPTLWKGRRKRLLNEPEPRWPRHGCGISPTRRLNKEHPGVWGGWARGRPAPHCPETGKVWLGRGVGVGQALGEAAGGRALSGLS